MSENKRNLEIQCVREADTMPIFMLMFILAEQDCSRLPENLFRVAKEARRRYNGDFAMLCSLLYRYGYIMGQRVERVRKAQNISA